MVTNRRGQRGVERGQGGCSQWKAKGQCSRGDKCSFPHDEDERAKSTPKIPLHPLCYQDKEVEVRREKGTSEARVRQGKSNRQPCRDFLNGICTQLLRDNMRPPECQIKKSESGCKFGQKCSFAHRQVEGQPSKKPKKGGDKSAVAILKDARHLGLRVSGHRAAGIFTDFTEEHKRLGISSTSYARTKRKPLTHACS